MRYLPLAVLLMLFILSACGNAHPSTAPSPSVSVPAVPLGNNDIFCETVFNHTDFPNNVTTCRALIKLAHTECQAYDRGVTFAAVEKAVLSNYDDSLGWSRSEYATNYGYALGAGVAAYCPKYKDILGSNA